MGCSSRCGGLRGREFGLKCLLEQGQMAIRLHPTELSLEGPQCRRAPAQLLIARAPARHAMRLGLESRHHTLDQIRRLETHAELREHVESMEREGFLKAFGEARGGRLID